MGLYGMVQNLADGSVEIVAEGPHYALLELLKWSRIGPPAAKVEEVIERWSDCKNEFNTFRISR